MCTCENALCLLKFKLTNFLFRQRNLSSIKFMDIVIWCQVSAISSRKAVAIWAYIYHYGAIVKKLVFSILTSSATNLTSRQLGIQSTFSLTEPSVITLPNLFLSINCFIYIFHLCPRFVHVIKVNVKKIILVFNRKRFITPFLQRTPFRRYNL